MPDDAQVDHRVGRGTRAELISRLTEAIGSVTTPHPVRVAIDGPPAAGKTTLADELAVVLRAQGRDIIRASIDDFLVPLAQRYRRGRYSAEGCYFDAHDRAALCRVLLDPLGPGGDRRVRYMACDRDVPAGAVLLFDGVFLLRPELLDRWDLRVFVSVPFERTVGRALDRGRASPVSTAEIERSWRERYIPSQRLYFATARPADHADIIVYNDQLERPGWEVRSPVQPARTGSATPPGPVAERPPGRPGRSRRGRTL
ncbi:cytidylate kinase family protein [Nonomuraea sp. NPDC050790]|uniref:cytidylate kinase family protein n=1 Tax=Nonomuraea sp. NPDC050790 TaxID=3364371 RepID=UPI0037A95F33